MASSHHFTLKFNLVWRYLCEDLLSFSTLVGQKRLPLSALSFSLKWRRYKGHFALNMKMKSSIIFADKLDALTATFAV